MTNENYVPSLWLKAQLPFEWLTLYTSRHSAPFCTAAVQTALELFLRQFDA